MTENKGAFINIGPDYKLKFTKFEAVPHPNIRPMVSSSSLSPFSCVPLTFLGLCLQLGHELSHVVIGELLVGV